ncbi:MAG: CHAT domain-containing protein [Gammaproteobacteria bacterium]|nr:CHAT domain-containing protein [Gammaproteobacteria bacterium]
MHYLIIIFLILLSGAGGSHADAVKNEDLIRKGDWHFNRGEYSEAQALYRQVHTRLKNQKPFPPALSEVINNIAAVYMARGELSRFREAFSISRNLKQRLVRKTAALRRTGTNILINGGFEDGLIFPWGTGHYERTDGKFRFGVWWNSKNAKAFMKIDADLRHGGEKSLRITNNSPSEPHVFSTLSQRITGLAPNSVYRISYYAKAENLSGGAVSFTIDAGWNKRLPAPPPGTYDWRRFETAVNIGHNDYIDFRIIHVNTGTLWLDDIFIESVETPDEQEVLQQAESLFDAGEYEAALKLYLQREQQVRDNPRALARAGWHSGRVYAALGKYAPALLRFEQAVAHGVARANIDLAGLYYRLGDYPAAEGYFKKSLKIVAGDQGSESLVLNKLSRCYLAMGRLSEALSAQRQAYRILKHIENKHGQALALNQLGVIYLRKNEYMSARMEFARALPLAAKLDDKQLRSDILFNQARTAYLNGNKRAARKRLNEALPIKEALQDQPGLVRAFRLQALLARKEHPGIAILFGKQAVNILQNLRAGLVEMDKSLQQVFVKDKAHAYQELADVLIEQGRLPEASQVLAMLKEEEYFDFVRRDAQADTRHTRAAYNAFEQPWVQRYRKINSQLAALGREQGELRKKARQNGLTSEEKSRRKYLRQEMRVANQAFIAYLDALKTAFKQVGPARAMEAGAKNLAGLRGLKGALRELGHGAVLLHYLITADKLRILLTTPEVQLAREAKVTEKALNRQIYALREALTNRRSRGYYREAKKLYDLVLAPVAEDLVQAEAQTLMLSLDGPLRYVPVAALYNDKQFVAERYAVVTYTEAARHNLTRQPKAEWTLAGMGLTREIPGFRPLPAVAEELESIVRRNADDPDGVLDGVVHLDAAFDADALLDTLDAGHPVMHIASHFVFRPGTEQDSYLLLGSGEKLNLAQIREEYEFHSLDLLTLSACETALGEQANGREIEGFGTLAQKNGAKGVLASLWPVDDQSTGQFMQALYRLRVNRGLTKAQALQQVQHSFIQARKRSSAAGYPHYYAHPYYWAPFILMGNWL